MRVANDSKPGSPGASLFSGGANAAALKDAVCMLSPKQEHNMIRPSLSDEREDAVKQRLPQAKVPATPLRSSRLRIHARVRLVLSSSTP